VRQLREEHAAGLVAPVAEDWSDGLQSPRSNGLQSPRSNGLQSPRSNGLQSPRSHPSTTVDILVPPAPCNPRAALFAPFSHVCVERRRTPCRKTGGCNPLAALLQRRCGG
jgi:hypothetical protein